MFDGVQSWLGGMLGRHVPPPPAAAPPPAPAPAPGPTPPQVDAGAPPPADAGAPPPPVAEASPAPVIGPPPPPARADAAAPPPAADAGAPPAPPVGPPAPPADAGAPPAPFIGPPVAPPADAGAPATPFIGPPVAPPADAGAQPAPADAGAPPPDATQAGPPPAAQSIPVPAIASGDKAALVASMQTLDSLKPADGGGFTIDGKNGPQTITEDQAKTLRAKAVAAIKDAAERVSNRASLAMGRYAAHQQVNVEHPLAAATAHLMAKAKAFVTGGHFEDPGPNLYPLDAKVTNGCSAAQGSARGGQFVAAAAALGDAEGAAGQISAMVEAYVSGMISAAETNVTVLEYTKTACFVIDGVIATVLTGGGAAGLTAAVGAEGVGGSVATASAIANFAPVVASAVGYGVQAAEGDPVDWTKATADILIQVVLAKFGGKMTEGLAVGVIGKLTGTVGTAVIDNAYVRKIIAAEFMQAGSAMIQTVAATVISDLKGKHVTWAQFLAAMQKAVLDPKGIIAAAALGAVSAKYPAVSPATDPNAGGGGGTDPNAGGGTKAGGGGTADPNAGGAADPNANPAPDPQATAPADPNAPAPAPADPNANPAPDPQATAPADPNAPAPAPADPNANPAPDPQATAPADPNAPAPAPADPNANPAPDPQATAPADPNAPAPAPADPNANPAPDPQATAPADPNAPAPAPADPNANPAPDPQATAPADPSTPAPAPADPNVSAAPDPQATAPADPNAGPAPDPNAPAPAEPNASAPETPALSEEEATAGNEEASGGAKPRRPSAKERRASEREATRKRKDGEPPAEEPEPEEQQRMGGPKVGAPKPPLDDVLEAAGIKMDNVEREQFGQWVKDRYGGPHDHYDLSTGDLQLIKKDVNEFRDGKPPRS
jgi:hypothetical protein